MTSEAAIAADGLTKRFGAVSAVEDLDLEVGRGEVFGYLGPNGAGKTTTIRLLLDFIRPTSGRCAVLGKSGRDPSIRRRIGYLPGELRVDPRHTGQDVIDFYGRLRGGVDVRYVAGLIERLDLDPTRPFRELSSGNRRKVGIVQAFMHTPELLLLDEPTAGLDPLQQQEFRHLLGEAADNGATVFLSSHVLPEVEAVSGRVGVLSGGRLVAVASVEELRRRARQRIEVHLGGEVDASVFMAVPGVVEATGHGDVVAMVVEGDVDAVVKALAHHHVRRIVTHEATLEDAFLSLYRPRQ